MDRILLAYDGSEESKRALDAAAALGGEGANVLVVTVAQPLSTVGFDTVPNPFSEEEQTEIVEEAIDLLTEKGENPVAVRPVGSRVEEIVGTAQDWDADLIVIGTRGYGLLGRMLFGSTSRGVVGRAPCNVLVVH